MIPIIARGFSASRLKSQVVSVNAGVLSIELALKYSLHLCHVDGRDLFTVRSPERPLRV